MHKRDDLAIAQVFPFEPIIKEKIASNNVEPATKIVNKGK